ncbi:MAG: 50S ribosomal protein L13 [bacterium]
MKTIVQRKWHILDAKDKILGRTAERAAVILRGKNKVNFTYHQDLGDYVVVINAEKAKFSGKKITNEFYRKHSGYLGGLKEMPKIVYFEKFPEKVIRSAVKGMLPKNRLSNQIIRRLQVFKGEEHPYKDKIV